MTETPPRFGSKRFREIFWTAFQARPLRAVCAIYWLLTRRRVRGWSRLIIAASEAPYNYTRWTKTGEIRAFARFRQSHLCRTAVQLVPLIVAEKDSPQEAVARSLAGLRSALGDEIPIFSTSEQADDCEPVPPEHCGSIRELAAFLANRDRTGWLFPVLAGDLVNPAILDILQRACSSAAGETILYWDEDTILEGIRRDPWIKPDWDGILFGELGGLGGSAIASIAAIEALEASLQRDPVGRESIERAFFSLGAEPHSPPPLHIPLILTHRSDRNALGLAVCERSKRQTKPIRGPWPSVSVIVPSRDRADLLASCLEGLHRTKYPGNLELIIVDNGTVEPAALRILDQVEADSRTRIIRDPSPFNFSSLNNFAATAADGEFLCFLNNDVEAIEDDWLEIMVAKAMDATVGAVGAMLLYPSGRLQHAGVAIGIGGAAGHIQKGVDPSEQRWWPWHAATREVSAVTAAAMVVSKDKFIEVGGFDADAFPVAFNDVDLCLRLKAAGYRNLYAAAARLIHRESESRGDDRQRRNADRYARELATLQERWNTKEFVDPHFSPLFSTLVEKCVLAP